MGDRYYITVECKCGKINEDVYFAPTCGFDTHRCEDCGKEINLCEYTGISYDDASNAGVMQDLVDKFADDKEPQ